MKATSNSTSEPEGAVVLRLQDEILKRTAQIHAICRLAGEARGESIGKVLQNAMWGVECLLDETEELINRLGELAGEKPSQPALKASSLVSAVPLAKSELSAVDGHAAGKKLAMAFLEAIRKSNDEGIEMKAIDALEQLRDVARGPVAPAVHLGFCEAVMESRAAGKQIDHEALGRDLAEIASGLLGIRAIAVEDIPTDSVVALQALAEKTGFLADRWLPRFGHTLVVGDTFDDWRTA